MTGLLVRGAYAGLALFGAAVLGLGGASLRLTLGFWMLGVALVWAKQAWGGWRTSRIEGRRL